MMARGGSGCRAQRSTNLHPSLLYPAGLLVLGASFGIGLLVFPAPEPRSTALTLAAANTVAADIVVAPEAAPAAQRPMAERPIAEPPIAEPPMAEPPQSTALLFDPTAMQPQALVAPEPPATDATQPGHDEQPSPIVKAQSPEPVRIQEPGRAQEPGRNQERARRKPAARQQVAAKQSSTEALRTVRRFGDNLQDIPVRSFAGNGKPLDIRIRPTSIQDVYYYSSRPSY
jgi:hypothetical protein